MSAMQAKLYALAQRLGVLLQRSHLQVVTCESCTGGMVAAAITEVVGSSEWFVGGLVTYSNMLKQTLLGVSESLLQEQGAVSEAVVKTMVEGGIRASGAQVAVAVSGIAGPSGGSRDKPVGLVWIAWQINQSVSTQCYQFSGNRQAVREQATQAALEGLIKLLE